MPDVTEVALECLKVAGPGQLLMVLRAVRSGSACPGCGTFSGRVHSRYLRKLSDLPWEGLPVQVQLRTRRFFCVRPECSQTIFTERLPSTVMRYGRRTCRLSRAYSVLAMALGGAAGARLAIDLGIRTSGDSLLRQLRSNARLLATRSPRVLGIDDWAWRKGRRYGTILCDLERGKVVDLLPDRSAESTGQWLRTHPGAEIVSRDRASLYAEAATKAAPHAIQVADRWHLLHNMSEALQGALVPHHRLLAKVAQVTAATPKAAIAPVEQQSPSPQPLSRKQHVQGQNRERRLARYEVVMDQLRQGASEREIARKCGLSRQTVHHWISARSFPERRPSSHTNTVDPHQEYLQQRWQQGCRNAAQLWRELREQGFAGQRRVVRDWIRKYCGPQRCPSEPCRSPSTPPRSSPRHVAWLLLKQPQEARPYLEELYRRSPEIATCASVAREFRRILRQRDAAAWVAWREAANASLLANFARHLCRDEAAVLAALHYRWSNGPVEGQVHRLKLIKRSMYGRANFDLLRLRVLQTA